MSRSLIRPLLAVGALSLLAACSDGGSKVSTAPAAPAAAPAPVGDPAAKGFVQASVTNDIFEIDASRVAIERSQNWDVKQYAQQVIDARSKAGGELQVTLNVSNLPIRPSTDLPADKAAAVAELRAIDPAKFDKLYLDAQVKAHEAALKTLEQYAEEGAHPALKAFAEKATPDVREQYQQAKALLGRVA